MRTLSTWLIIGAVGAVSTAARAQNEGALPASSQERPMVYPEKYSYPYPGFVPRTRQLACRKWMWGWIALGTGGAVLLTAAVTGTVAVVKMGDLEDRCPNKHCLEDSDRDLRESVDTYAQVTDLMLSVGGVLALTGSVFLIGALSDFKALEKGPVGVAPVISKETGGLVVAWRF